MKSSLSIDEYDLVWFFSALPKQMDDGVPWEYNDSVYEASDSQLHLSFAIAPAVKDVRILVTIGGTCVYEFNAMGIADVPDSVRIVGDPSIEESRVIDTLTSTPLHC